MTMPWQINHDLMRVNEAERALGARDAAHLAERDRGAGHRPPIRRRRAVRGIVVVRAWIRRRWPVGFRRAISAPPPPAHDTTPG
jgi:hypothetical protein